MCCAGFYTQSNSDTLSNPPCFDGVHSTVTKRTLEASILQQEVKSFFLKGAIEEVSPKDLNLGFYSRYFFVPKSSVFFPLQRKF